MFNRRTSNFLFILFDAPVEKFLQRFVLLRAQFRAITGDAILRAVDSEIVISCLFLVVLEQVVSMSVGLTIG